MKKIILTSLLLIPAISYAAPYADATAHIDLNPNTIAYVGVTKDIPVYAKIFISNDSFATENFTWVVEVCPKPDPASCHVTKGQLALTPGQNYIREYPMTIKAVYHNEGKFIAKMSTTINGAASSVAGDTKMITVKN